MKNTSFFKTLTLFAAFALVSAVSVHAETWSYEFEKPAPFTSNGTESLDGISWTLDGDGGFLGWDGNTNKGQQFGSSGNPYTSLSLSTSDFVGTINSVVVNAATASKGVAFMSLTVGGAPFGSEQSLTSESADYTFSGSAAGEIVISMTQTSSKALYIKSITVDYTPGVVAVVRPVATPAAGFYTEAQNVTLTCATEGATIRYTLDGKEPTATSTEYTAPIAISKTTTLKAIAIKGEDISSVLTAEYEFPAVYENIAALMSASPEKGTKILISGTVTVTYQNGSYLYVSDNTGAMLIYGYNIGTFANGDTFTGLSGEVDIFYAALQIKDPELPAPGKGGKIEPAEMKPEDITKEDVHSYIILRGVETPADLTLSEDSRDGEIVSGSGTLALYNNYKFDFTLKAGVKYDMVAIVGYREDDKGARVQLYPITVTESAGSAVRPVSVKGVEAYSADGVLYVSAAVGDRIEVYSLLGSLLYNAPAADAVTAIEGLPQSVVIVRVGRAATKVVVR